MSPCREFKNPADGNSVLNYHLQVQDFRRHLQLKRDFDFKLLQSRHQSYRLLLINPFLVVSAGLESRLTIQELLRTNSTDETDASIQFKCS
jgi:hypothetical protein